MRLLRSLLTAQMIGMSLSSVMLAAHPPIVLAIFLATTAPFLAIGLRGEQDLHILSMLGWGGAIFLAMGVGYALNPLSADPPVRVAMVFLVFTSGWFAARLIGRDTVIWAMVLAGAAGLIATLVELYREGLTGYLEEGDRLTGGEESHPNLVGLTMVCTALGAGPMANVWLRYALWGTAFFVSTVVQSRNSLLALIILLALWLWRDVVRRLSAATIVVLLLCLVGTAIFEYEAVKDIFAKLFMLDNPYRGSGSDLVGREQLWAATWTLFTQHPIFGYGLGQHTIGAQIDMYAHNMYLIVLSESGHVGFFAFVGATIIAARGLFVRESSEAVELDRLSFALLLILLTYYAYGVFEGRAVNAGNFLSYLFFFAWGYGICRFDAARNLARPPEFATTR